MKILQVSGGSISALFLVVLMVSSARAAPLLSVGSDANYQLNASMQSSQSCNALPVSYNQTACGPYRPMHLVEIIDNGTCTPAQGGFSCSYGYYSYVYPTKIFPGTTVMWFNRGTLTHTVTSDSTNTGLPFDSGPLAHDASYFFTFTTLGNYGYHDTNYPWLNGSIIVTDSVFPTPIVGPPSSFMPTVSFAGSLGWTVNGLDNSVAVLNVTHQVSIVATSGAISFTPATEAGSFPQSVNLSTRIESPGTASSVILSLAQRMLAYLGSLGYRGYGYGYSPLLGQSVSDPKPVYTFWWVNGPLTNGQPVQILTGYASVIGSETVNLGPGNNRNAWIVDSQISQSLSTTVPPLFGQGISTSSNFKLDLRFDYDQASDFLLRAIAVVSMQSTQIQSYRPGDYLCGPSGCFPVSDPVTVTHHMDASVPVSLHLKSTSLDLSKRMAATSLGSGQPSTGGTGGSSGTSILSPATAPWIYAGIGIVGAGAVVTAAWLLRRRGRMKTTTLGQPGTPSKPEPHYNLGQ